MLHYTFEKFAIYLLSLSSVSRFTWLFRLPATNSRSLISRKLPQEDFPLSFRIIDSAQSKIDFLSDQPAGWIPTAWRWRVDCEIEVGMNQQFKVLVFFTPHFAFVRRFFYVNNHLVAHVTQASPKHPLSGNASGNLPTNWLMFFSKLGELSTTRNLTVYLIRRAKKNFMNKVASSLADSSTSPKKRWSYAKYVHGNKKLSSIPHF